MHRRRSRRRRGKTVALWLAMVLLVSLFPPRLGSGSHPVPSRPHYTQQDRDAAVERGLQFIYKLASNPEYFSRWGPDLMFCFYTISSTAKNQKLREMALTMGQERARQWRRNSTAVPTDDPDDLASFVNGTHNADLLLGGYNAKLKSRVVEAARRFSAVDFLSFDPRIEPPPSDLPERCPKCNHRNPRGRQVCEKCGTALTFRNRYDVWLDSLIRTYQGDVYGVTLGASYSDALHWITTMRPYPAADDESSFDDVSYVVTHVIYTLNDYHRYRLSPSWLPQEFNYLKMNITQAAHFEDGELIGEFMDALRAFGEDDGSPEIRAAMDYLLSTQNPDGSWGDLDDGDLYTRYHSTWTAIDGLRQYTFHGERLRLPQLQRLLRADPPPTDPAGT